MFSVSGFQSRRAGSFGETLYYFEQIDSTNLVAEQLAREGAAEGTVVLANEQTGGKGRKGNAWFSPADVNLYFSLVLRPEASALRFLPYMICLAVRQALLRLDIETDLKWPNDVVVGGRKLCGILILTAMEDRRLQHAVIGCGVNVNVRDFPADLKATATSVFLETGAEAAREPLLASILLEFERLYEKIDATDWAEFAGRLEQVSTYLRGCEVRVMQEGQVVEGVTCGLDSYGGLVLRTDAGDRPVYAGEVISCRRV